MLGLTSSINTDGSEQKTLANYAVTYGKIKAHKLRDEM